jgi:hypothetical protein
MWSLLAARTALYVFGMWKQEVAVMSYPVIPLMSNALLSPRMEARSPPLVMTQYAYGMSLLDHAVIPSRITTLISLPSYTLLKEI